LKKNEFSEKLYKKNFSLLKISFHFFITLQNEIILFSFLFYSRVGELEEIKFKEQS